MMKTAIIYRIIFASLLLVGCTKVELCEEGEHPHVVEGFSLVYNWEELGLSATETPEKLYFVATRILNTRHMIYQTDKDGKFWIEKDDNDASGNTPDDSESGLVVSDDAMESEGEYQSDIKLPGGEYFMMAFTDPAYPKIDEEQRDAEGNIIKDKDGNATLMKVKDTRVELVGLDEFREDNAIHMKEIKMRHHAMKSVTDIVHDTWKDLNPGIGYVWDAGRTFFISRCEYLELNAGSDYKQPFNFVPLTQHIDINFFLDLVEDENNVQVKPEDIEYIFVEIAGVVPEVSLSTGLLNTSSLKRVIVKVPVPATGEAIIEEDGRKCTILKCTASMDVFGLIGGMDNYAIMGPGVCCLALSVNAGTKGITSYGIANLSKKIKDLGLTEETGQINERRKLKDSGTLAIDVHLRITQSGMEGGAGSDGIIDWVDIKNEIHEDI